MAQQTMIVRTTTALLISAALASLAGCASSLVGYDAQTTPSCPASNDGVPCTNMTDIYKASSVGGLPGQQPKPLPPALAKVQQQSQNWQSEIQPQTPGYAVRPPLDSGMPVRTPPHVLRALIFPWEDPSGVVSDQKLIYLTLDSGRWMLGQNQQKLMDEFAPTQLVLSGPTGAGGARESAKTSNPAKVQPAMRSGNLFAPGAQTSAGQ